MTFKYYNTSINVPLTAWNKVLLEKLIVAQLAEKFPSFYEIRRPITLFTAPSNRAPS
jgi:hypothetical protein